MKKSFKEIAHYVLILLPFFYLYSIWKQLPDKVATHFNLEGIADDWSEKTMLVFIPAALPLFIYLLMRVIPILDPRKKLIMMGAKYDSLRFIFTCFFSILSLYMLHASLNGSLQNPKMLVAIIAALFVLLGNYFQTVRPNYFLGVRTPWTLENETVWNNTHRLAGRIWMAGGILIILLSFGISKIPLLVLLSGCILLIMIVVPVVFSYTEFKKIQNSKPDQE